MRIGRLGLVALGFAVVFALAVGAGYLMGQTSFRTPSAPSVPTMPSIPSPPFTAPGAPASPEPPESDEERRIMEDAGSLNVFGFLIKVGKRLLWLSWSAWRRRSAD